MQDYVTLQTFIVSLIIGYLRLGFLVDCRSASHTIRTYLHENGSVSTKSGDNTTLTYDERVVRLMQRTFVNSRDCGLASLRDWQAQQRTYACSKNKENSLIGKANTTFQDRQTVGLNRMAVGYNPKLEEVPSYLQVAAFDQQGGKSTCAAALIAENLAVTAEHCVAKPYDYDVLLTGGTARNLAKEYVTPEGAQTIRVSKICRVSPGSLDVAIMRLESPFELSDRLRPACIELSRSRAGGAQCISVGTGIIDNYNNTDNFVRAAPTTNCFIDWFPPFGLSCTTFTDKWQGNLCEGDSGSPLYCFDSCYDPPRMFVAGLFSTAASDEYQCVPGTKSAQWHTDFWKVRNLMLSALEDCSRD